jgi:hypothetical protein
MDVDPSIDSIEHLERYPLTSRLSASWEIRTYFGFRGSGSLKPSLSLVSGRSSR